MLLVYFFMSVRFFYATLITHMKTRFNFNDEIFDIFLMVKPKNARQLFPIN